MFKRFRQFQYVFVGLVYISTIIFVFYSFDHNTKPAIASSVVTIQPSSVDGKDSTITPFNNMHEFNFGDQNDLYGGIVRMSQHGLLVEFDISTFLASTAVISSADLSLYFPTGIYAENSADLSIHRVDEAWDEATVNWANQPGFNTTPEDTVTIGDSSAPGWYSFDITDLVQKWVYGEINGDLVNGFLNNGVFIDGSETLGIDFTRMFYGSDYLGDPSLRPKLRVQGEEGLPPVPFDRTSQPNDLLGKDTQIADMSPAQNYGTENILGSGTMDFAARSLLEFDLSSVSESASITSASLELYYGGAYFFNDLPVGLTIKRVNEAWDENIVTWVNQPEFNTTPEDTVTIGDSSAPGWYSFDITDLVQGWLDGDHPNYGVIIDFIEAIGSTDAKTFYSSDYTIDETLRPKLVIKYEEGAAPVSAYHHECSNNMCTTVSGVGEDECQNNSQCLVEVSTLTEEDSSSQAVTILPATGVDRDRLFATWFLLPWLKMIVKTF